MKSSSRLLPEQCLRPMRDLIRNLQRALTDEAGNICVFR